MADNQFEIPQAMRDLAEQNMKQARTAYGQLTDFMNQAMGAWMGMMPSNPMAVGFQNVQAQAMEFVMMQTQLAQDCMQAFFAQTQQLQSMVPEASRKPEAQQEMLGSPPSNTMIAGFKDVQGRVVDMAKQNAEHASGLVGKIAGARDTQEILTVQTKFVQEQMQTFVAQMQEIYALIGETLQKSAHG